MTNAINMLPCPMCGCSSINVKNEQPTDNSGGYFIECPDCGISTSLRYACGDDPIPLLAKQWNRRATAQCLHQIAEPSSQTPEDAQIQALMRKHRIWIEHSTLFENDEPERELRAVQAEEHQFNAFVQDLIAATQLAAAPQAVPAAVAVPDELVRVVDLKSVGDRFYRGNWVSEEGVSELIDAALAATPPAAHPAEGVPAPFSASGIAPCPLCGSASKHVKLGEDRGHRILCWNDDCECSSGYFSSKEDAIASWNSRAALANTQPAAQGMDADMFWDSEDGERCEHDIESIIEDYSDGAILKIDCAKSLPSMTIRVIQNAEGADYEIVDAALAAQAKQGGVNA